MRKLSSLFLMFIVTCPAFSFAGQNCIAKVGPNTYVSRPCVPQPASAAPVYRADPRSVSSTTTQKKNIEPDIILYKKPSVDAVLRQVELLKLQRNSAQK